MKENDRQPMTGDEIVEIERRANQNFGKISIKPNADGETTHIILDPEGGHSVVLAPGAEVSYEPPVCEHHWVHHAKGGEPLGVSICSQCRMINWDLLREDFDRACREKYKSYPRLWEPGF